MYIKKYTNITNRIMVMSSIMVCLAFCTGCKNGDNRPPEELVAEGRKSYSQGNVDDATKLFKKALKLRPEDGSLHYELGMMSYKECEKSYDVALQRVLAGVLGGRLNNTADNEKQLIRHGYRKDLCNVATLEFAAALKYDESNWRARYFVASDLFKNKQYDQAIYEFKKVIKDNPEYPDTYGYLGRAYLETGQYEDAKTMLQKAHDMKPSDYKLYLLGLAYKGLNDREKLVEIKKKLKGMNSIYFNSLMDQ